MPWQPIQSLHWIHGIQPLPDYYILEQFILVAGIIRSPEGDSCSGALPLRRSASHIQHDGTSNKLPAHRWCSFWWAARISPQHIPLYTCLTEGDKNTQAEKPITSDQKERLIKEQMAVKTLKVGENCTPNSHLAPPWHSSITCQKFLVMRPNVLTEEFFTKKTKQKPTNKPPLTEQAYQLNVIDIHWLCCLWSFKGGNYLPSERTD